MDGEVVLCGSRIFGVVMFVVKFGEGEILVVSSMRASSPIDTRIDDRLLRNGSTRKLGVAICNSPDETCADPVRRC